ncbi:MAG: hypothetical protein ACREN7_00135 [Candidatus Dormibacteria bacterium]
MTPDQLAARLAESELELVAHGYSQDQAEMATRQATRWAQSFANRLPPSQRDAALQSLIEDALQGSPAWLDGCARAASEREYAREMQRAARDGQFKRSLQTYGGGKRTDKAWRKALPEAEENWAKTFSKG